MRCNICHNRDIIKHEIEILKEQIEKVKKDEQKLPWVYIRKLNLELKELEEILSLSDDELVEEVECVCEH